YFQLSAIDLSLALEYSTSYCLDYNLFYQYHLGNGYNCYYNLTRSTKSSFLHITHCFTQNLQVHLLAYIIHPSIPSQLPHKQDRDKRSSFHRNLSLNQITPIPVF